MSVLVLSEGLRIVSDEELMRRAKSVAGKMSRRRPYICGTCGERPKDCHCAEDQEERKIKELLALDAALPSEYERKSEP